MRAALSLVFLFCFSLFLVVCEGYVHFHGYSVLRCLVDTNEKKQIIESLDLDVWSRDNVLVLGWNDVMVNGSQKEVLVRNGIAHKVFIEDVEQLISQERDYHLNLKANGPQDFYDSYHPYDEIVAYHTALAVAHDQLSRFIPSIGTTLEGRPIFAIHVSAGTNPNKKRIFISGTQHAREWVAPSTVTYIVEQLLTRYENEEPIRRLLENIEFVFVPVVNADGYAYTWTNNRLWRKNRRPNSDGSYGVDLNRNWDDHWGGPGSSPNPPSETYHGTGPFSEPETKVTSDYILRYSPFQGALDYHSYSQLVLRPYGWTSDPPPNDAVSKVVGDAYSAAIRATTGVNYVSEPGWTLYYTTGGVQDWFSTPAKVPVPITVELRDTGEYGFVLPVEQIRPTAQENWEGFKVLANYVLANITI